MSGNRACRNRCANQRTAEQPTTCGQTTQEVTSSTTEDVPMYRHVGTVTDGCDVGRQLWALNRLLETQNCILAQLLQAARENRQ